MTNRLLPDSLSPILDISPGQGTLTRPTLQSSQVLQARLDATTPSRDYRFTLVSSTNVSLLLNSPNGNVDLKLSRNLGANQPLQPIATSANLGLTPEVVGTLLTAGEYYVQVSTDLPSQAIDYSFTFATATIGPGYTPTGPELFWVNQDGMTAYWSMGGERNIEIQTGKLFEAVPVGWQLASVADWNQDGIADLVWRNAAASETRLWLMGGENGLIRQSEQVFSVAVPAGWDIVGCADWNNDGTMDLVWRNDTAGLTGVWLLGGENKVTIQKVFLLGEVPSDWQIKSVVDFDRNGTQDILWRNSITGMNAVWFMGDGADGTELASAQILNTIPLEWDIVGTANWDQDTTPDILWQNRLTGQRAVWFMNQALENSPNLTIRAGELLQSVPTTWSMRPYASNRIVRNLDAIGNNLQNAFNLGTLRSSEFQDWIGSGDGNDFYQFSLTENTRFSVNLNQLPEGTDIVLLDSTGQVIPFLIAPERPPSRTEQLAAGQYYLQVKSNSSSNNTYKLKLDAFGVETWLSDIGDVDLRTEIRSRLADKVLDRTDVLSILRAAGDGNVVDAVEFSDLARLSRNFLDLNSDSSARNFDFVGNLLSKVVGSNVANAMYKGQTLGNLAAGSTKVQLDALIDKWFLGGDRPMTSYTYTVAAGRLVRNGLAYSDISQGDVKNSSFLASLAAAINNNPQFVSQMFRDNGDGSYTVRFFKPDKTTDYVTIDRSLPTDLSTGGTFAYAKQYFTLGGERSVDDPDNELWVAFAEKAFVQWLASGSISTITEGSNRYSNLSLVSTQAAMSAVLGGTIEQRSVTASAITSLSFEELRRPLVFVSKASYEVLRSDVVANQTYSFIQTSTDRNTGEIKYKLFNPWGTLNQLSDPQDTRSNPKPGEIEMTAIEIAESFDLMYWNI